MVNEYRELTYKGAVVFNKLNVDAPKRELKPFKDNEACFMFVNEGVFNVRTPDQLFHFNIGEGMLAKCFNFFIETDKFQQKDNPKLEFIGVFIFPEIVEELLQSDALKSNHVVDYNLKQIHIDKLLVNFKQSIEVLLENPELASEDMIEAKLKEFILLISKTQGVSQRDFLSAIFQLNNIDFKTIIKANLYTNLTVPEFALLCSMSVSTFKRKFAEIFNDSPKQYLLKMKLARATELLAFGTLRVAEIAYECGFDTLSTFNRSFKASYRKSPSAYRLSYSA